MTTLTRRCSGVRHRGVRIHARPPSSRVRNSIPRVVLPPGGLPRRAQPCACYFDPEHFGIWLQLCVEYPFTRASLHQAHSQLHEAILTTSLLRPRAQSPSVTTCCSQLGTEPLSSAAETAQEELITHTGFPAGSVAGSLPKESTCVDDQGHHLSLGRRLRVEEKDPHVGVDSRSTATCRADIVMLTRMKLYEPALTFIRA